MPKTQFQNEATTCLQETFGSAAADEVPTAPPDWCARQFSNHALLERSWDIFRKRLAGMTVHSLAQCYGMREPEVRQASYAVLTALTHARGPSPEASDIVAHPEATPVSTLARDCQIVNEHLSKRPGVRRLMAERLVGIGIHPNSSLARVPDEDLLMLRGIGPRVLAEIRRLFPFEPHG